MKKHKIWKRPLSLFLAALLTFGPLSNVAGTAYALEFPADAEQGDEILGKTPKTPAEEEHGGGEKPDVEEPDVEEPGSKEPKTEIPCALPREEGGEGTEEETGSAPTEEGAQDEIPSGEEPGKAQEEETEGMEKEESEYPTLLTCDTTDEVTVCVEGSAEALNGAVLLSATRLPQERADEYRAVLKNAEKLDGQVQPPDTTDVESELQSGLTYEKEAIETVYVYDIALFNRDGEQIEPTGPVTVTFALKDLAARLAGEEEKMLKVYHNLDTTLTEEITCEETMKDGEDGPEGGTPEADLQEEEAIDGSGTEEPLDTNAAEASGKDAEDTAVSEKELLTLADVAVADTLHIPVSMDGLEELPVSIEEDGLVTVTTDSFSEYALVLSGNESQKERRLWNDYYLEIDKYLKKKGGEVNNQATYDIYLEQALYDSFLPDVVENYAPKKQNITLVLDQSSSMSGTDKLPRTNEALRTMLERIYEINQSRIEAARSGEFTDIDVNGDVDAQMRNHLLCVQYVLGFNNHVYNRYISHSGTAITSPAMINSIYNQVALVDDLDAYLNGNDNTDMQVGTRMDYALQGTLDLLSSHGALKDAQVIIITDGKPTDPPKYTRDLGSYCMSSQVTNGALRAARSMKDGGATIYGVYMDFDAMDEIVAAKETGNIRDIAPGMGLIGVYMSLMSSDYPLNGTLGTVSGGTAFDYTYTFEEDDRNGFGKHIYLTDDLNDMFAAITGLPSVINSVGSNNPVGYAGAASMIQEVISDPFELMASGNVKVYKVPRIPLNLNEEGKPDEITEDGMVTDFRWGEERIVSDDPYATEWIDITGEVALSVSQGRIIKVTGFDYEANAVVNYDRDSRAKNPQEDAWVYHPGDYGYKVVVVLPVNAKTTFGGNGIETNNSDATNFYPSIPSGYEPDDPNFLPFWKKNTDLNPEGNDFIEKYPVPKVDLTVNYDIVCDNAVVYAPQTAPLRNIITDANNSLWYRDDQYLDLKAAADQAYDEYQQIITAITNAQVELGKLDPGDPKYAEASALVAQLDSDQYAALAVYQKAQKELEGVDNYTPDGINNAFVNITYELKDPKGEVVGALSIPHGKAYVVDEKGAANFDWEIKGGKDTILVESGIYALTAVVTPVDTVRAPGGHVYTEADHESIQESIGYSSTDYSPTGSSAAGSQSALTIIKKPEAYLYQLKIVMDDTRLDMGQTLDFYMGNENLIKTDNPHLVSYEWVCTDGETPSVKANEPGITGLMKVGSGVTMVNQIPDLASDLVADIDGTIVTNCEDGGYVPVAVNLFRTVGNLDKSESLENQTKQTHVYMTDSDDIYGKGVSSVIWDHLCDVITDADCNEQHFKDAGRYSEAEGESGKGKVRYLIHVWTNPAPEIHKTTSTPIISKGENIFWNVSVSNTDEEKNPNLRASEFSMVDILPWKGDGRIDPKTNFEGSEFSGSLYYKKALLNFKDAPQALARLKSGECKLYATEEEGVRTADESQILGSAADKNVSWTGLPVIIDGTSVSVSGISDKTTALKLDTILAWGETISIDLTANLVDSASQIPGDRYHNEAWALNGKGITNSETVATTVTSLFLSGTIWEDVDANGTMEEGEPRMKDVVVTLYTEYNPDNGGEPERIADGVKLIRAFDVSGDKYGQVLTDDTGEFLFNNIQPGNYFIIADQIPAKYEVTVKQAGDGDEGLKELDSEAEEAFIINEDKNLDKSAWIRNVVITDTGVRNQNIGLKMIRGTIRIGKTLNEIYFPASMSDEEREEYWLTFTFKLKETTTGETYMKPVKVHRSTKDLKDGRAQAWATFEGIPLGTYELTEVSTAQYEIASVDTGNTSAVYNAGSKTVTIPVTPTEWEYELIVNNKLVKDPPGGDQNGVGNWINVRVPVSLDITYVGADPISSATLTEYTFVESDFAPAKGGDMVVTYDDGTTISLSEGTLRFDQVTLYPKTITNDMNSGKDKITISGYYSEKGRTVADSFRVAIDLKPIHKFILNFNSNGSVFSNGDTINSVKFGYDENKGENYVTSGTYKDVNNGLLNSRGTSYTFAGWNTKYDGTGIQYSGFAALNALGKDTGVSALTLYANWKTLVTFDANKGVLAGGSTDAERVLAGKTSGSISYNVNQTIATGLSATRSGYAFLSWNTKADGTGTDLNEYGRITGPVTFYAVYYKTDYGYTGNVQTFVAPLSGTYNVSLWGAQGWGVTSGSASSNYAGKGGYVTGNIYLEAGTLLYVYVGGQGQHVNGGWNGGGAKYGNYSSGGGGGGSTDIRLNSAISSRIMVAGGGGGSDDYPSGNDGGGGHGGGLSGGNGHGNGGGRGGTQTSGNALYYGGNSNNDDAGGGGGGYYGGIASSNINGGGGGGSSYASGMSGCVTHSSRYVFTNASTVAGSRTGDGYAKFVLVSR